MSGPSASGWPSLQRTGPWPDSQAYIHLVTQMMGKLRLALAPSQPECLHASLALSARGLTTGPLPAGDRSLEVALDSADGALDVLASDGSKRRISLSPARHIAEVWLDLGTALEGLGAVARMRDKPQEIESATPFSQDHRERTYDPHAVAAFFAVLTAVHHVFDAWRAPFFGRTALGFWWGAFDLTATLFSGRRATPREGADHIRRYELDAESVVVGFWPGDAHNEATFFAYIVPEPPGCAALSFGLQAARWDAGLGEWILPYEAVRTTPDPRGALLGFLDTVYEAAGSLAGWDLADHRQERPTSR
jgi:hypothetical protein